MLKGVVEVEEVVEGGEEVVVGEMEVEEEG